MYFGICSNKATIDAQYLFPNTAATPQTGQLNRESWGSAHLAKRACQLERLLVEVSFFLRTMRSLSQETSRLSRRALQESLLTIRCLTLSSGQVYTRPQMFSQHLLACLLPLLTLICKLPRARSCPWRIWIGIRCARPCSVIPPKISRRSPCSTRTNM